VDNDTGVSTYSLAGAEFGWYALVADSITVILFIVQEMEARMGVVSARSFGSDYAERLGLSSRLSHDPAVIPIWGTLWLNSPAPARRWNLRPSRYLTVPLASYFSACGQGTYKSVEFFLACLFTRVYVVTGFLVRGLARSSQFRGGSTLRTD
jgi:hypothetical protein